jgi:hypothetical protein
VAPTDGAFNDDLSSCPYTALSSMLASSMLNKINPKHAACTDIHTIAYTCSGIHIRIHVLGDHVTYYSIHDVAVSFMEIGKIVKIFRYAILLLETFPLKYVGPRMWPLFLILYSCAGTQISVVDERNCTNSVLFWSLFVVVLSRVGIFSIFYSVWE